MSEPTGKVNVSIADILNQVHAKYSRSIAALVQELAEAQAAMDQLNQQLDEARATINALTAHQPDWASPQTTSTPIADDLATRIDLGARRDTGEFPNP